METRLLRVGKTRIVAPMMKTRKQRICQVLTFNGR
jgi:hypothetical protein